MANPLGGFTDHFARFKADTEAYIKAREDNAMKPEEHERNLQEIDRIGERLMELAKKKTDGTA